METAWPVVVVAVVGVFLIARFVRSLGDAHALARGGHANRLEALLEHDRALASAKDDKGETPLHHAARHGELAAMKVLLAHGADPNAKTPVGATPLHVARALGEERAVKLLIESGAKDDGGGDDEPAMKRAIERAKDGVATLRELHAEHPDTTMVRVDGEWRKAGDLERDLEVLTDWKVELPDGTVRGGYTHAVAFARAKKDLGALPEALADEEKRFVDH